MVLVSVVLSLMPVEVVVEVRAVDPVDLLPFVPDVDVFIELEEVVPTIIKVDETLVLVGIKLVLFEVIIKSERKAVVVVVSNDFVVAFVLVVNEFRLHPNEFA